MTQYLIEEAVMFRPRVDEINVVRAREADQEAERLLERHAELTAMRGRTAG